MAAQTTLIGNLASDVELRYTNTGKPVGSVTIAVSDRVRNKQSGEYEDGPTWWARCTIWGELAEHASSSLHKGVRVIAQGRLVQRDWEDKQGQKRTSVEVTVDAIGPELKWATANVTRTGGRGGAGGANGAAVDQWATPGGFDAQAQAQHVQGGWDDAPAPF